MEQMTDDQRKIIEESKSKDVNLRDIDQDKLKEAQKLAAMIEASSYSKYDTSYENKY